MPRATARVSYSEFVSDPAGVLERVIRDNEPVTVEKDDSAVAVVRPVRPARPRRRRRTTPADMEAFRRSAGSWKDVDIDRFIADIYDSRSRSSRPPVEL